MTGQHSPRWRSLSVSLLTTALDAGLFALCTLVLVGPLLVLARWLCGALGAASNFLLNRVWAFGTRRGRLWAQALRYAATAVVAVTLATALWWLLLRLTGWDPRLLHPLSLALVWLGFTFPALRGWVFRQRRAAVRRTVGVAGAATSGSAPPAG
jgi:putative flippase GtrA